MEWENVKTFQEAKKKLFSLSPPPLIFFVFIPMWLEKNFLTLPLKSVQFLLTLVIILRVSARKSSDLFISFRRTSFFFFVRKYSCSRFQCFRLVKLGPCTFGCTERVRTHAQADEESDFLAKPEDDSLALQWHIRTLVRT